MRIHKSPVQNSNFESQFITPVGDRQRSDVIELIRLDKYTGNVDPCYIRSVQFNISSGFVPQDFTVRLREVYRALVRGEYHQILVRIPRGMKLQDLLYKRKVKVEDGDVIEWTPDSYISIFVAMRSLLKDPK